MARRNLPHPLSRCFSGKLAITAALIGRLFISQTAAFSLVAVREFPTPFRTRLDTTTNRGNTGSFLRWKATNDIAGNLWEMQTAVTPFQKENRIVHLHAMIHFGSLDYYSYYNDIKTPVLFELLVDESLLTRDGNLRRIKPGTHIQATHKDQSVATQYGWSFQADAIRYDHRNWFHADLSTQEFLKQVASPQSQPNARPLWQLASNEGFPAPAMEAATALMVGPPFLSAKRSKRKLFSNLFVPGSTVATILRACLWFTVPAPELPILILDWSSLTSMSVSQIIWPLAEAIAKGQFTAARQLIFGQVALLASKGDNELRDDGDLLISQRNERAMQVLDQLDPSIAAVSLLYGCNHCPDLQRRLEEQGFTPKAKEWRTAWSVRLDRNSKVTGLESDGSSLSVIFLLVLPIYLLVGAFDWLSTWQGVVQSNDWLDFSALSSFYLLRHVIAYSALSKYVLDWNDDRNEDIITKTES